MAKVYVADVRLSGVPLDRLHEVVGPLLHLVERELSGARRVVREIASNERPTNCRHAHPTDPRRVRVGERRREDSEVELPAELLQQSQVAAARRAPLRDLVVENRDALPGHESVDVPRAGDRATERTAREKRGLAGSECEHARAAEVRPGFAARRRPRIVLRIPMGPRRAAGAASRRRLGPLAARAGWGIADQALSSATNFALGVMVARSVAPSEFGLFALIFAAYVLLLGTSRSLSTDPLIVRFGASEWAQLRGRAVRALGTALGFGTICALVGALIILMLDVVLGMRFHSAPFYLLAASLPGLLLEDALRYVFFARRAPRSALVVDASAAVALALAFLWIALGNTRTLSWFVAAWGVSGLVSAAVGLRLGRLWPRIGGMRRW